MTIVSIGVRQLTVKEPHDTLPYLRTVGTGRYVPTITLSGDISYEWEGRRSYASMQEAYANLLDDATADGDGVSQLNGMLQPYYDRIAELLRTALAPKNLKNLQP